MKRIILLIFLIVMLFNVPFIKAAENSKEIYHTTLVEPSKKTNKLSDEEIRNLTDRLEKIMKMDKSSLSKEEKRELRKEVRDIKKKLDVGYIYISGTAILIIILILLLL